MNRLLCIFTLLFTLFLSPIDVLAHSGNTDSNGGHVCRTNCEQYGLEYGQYHYHGNYSGLDISDEREIDTSDNEEDNNNNYEGIIIFILIIVIGYSLIAIVKKIIEDRKYTIPKEKDSKALSKANKIFLILAGILLIANITLIYFLFNLKEQVNTLEENKGEQQEKIEELQLVKEKDSSLNDKYNDLKKQFDDLQNDYDRQVAYIEELEQQLEANTQAGKTTTDQSNDEDGLTTTTSDGYFTLGSSKDEVKTVMGTPDSIIGDMWSYEYSSISFSNEAVDGWSDISDNLKVRINKVNSNAGSFTIGSTYQDVVDVMGTPDSIIGEIWGYEYSTITFSDGIVDGWSDISNNLKVQ